MSLLSDLRQHLIEMHYDVDISQRARGVPEYNYLDQVHHEDHATTEGVRIPHRHINGVVHRLPDRNGTSPHTFRHGKLEMAIKPSEGVVEIVYKGQPLAVVGINDPDFHNGEDDSFLSPPDGQGRIVDGEFGIATWSGEHFFRLHTGDLDRPFRWNEVRDEYRRLREEGSMIRDCSVHRHAGCTCAPAIESRNKLEALINRYFEPLLDQATEGTSGS